MLFLMYWYGRLRHPRKYRQHMQYVDLLNNHLDYHVGGIFDQGCAMCTDTAQEGK